MGRLIGVFRAEASRATMDRFAARTRWPLEGHRVTPGNAVFCGWVFADHVIADAGAITLRASLAAVAEQRALIADIDSPMQLGLTWYCLGVPLDQPAYIRGFQCYELGFMSTLGLGCAFVVSLHSLSSPSGIAATSCAPRWRYSSSGVPNPDPDDRDKRMA